jgi:hypothetical protein
VPTHHKLPEQPRLVSSLYTSDVDDIIEMWKMMCLEHGATRVAVAGSFRTRHCIM